MNCKTVEKNRCASCNSNAVITAMEKRSTYRLNNKSRRQVCKVKIDGCYIKGGKRCDYLIIDCDLNSFYFIELKGNHLLTAVDQIEQTINYFQQHLGNAVYARIVPSKVSVPNLQANPKILKLRRRLKGLGGTLEIKSRQLEETI